MYLINSHLFLFSLLLLLLFLLDSQCCFFWCPSATRPLCLLQVALGEPSQVKPFLLRTDGTSSPPTSSTRTIKPCEPGSEAALFYHQGMFSLDIISRLLVQELHPEFFFFVLFFSFNMQQETRQDVSQIGLCRLKDTVCAPTQNQNNKRTIFKMSFLLSALTAVYLSTHCLYSI